MFRDGSEQDIKSLTHAFERFGIVATVKSDLQLNSIVNEIHTRKQLLVQLQLYSKHGHMKYSETRSHNCRCIFYVDAGVMNCLCK